MKPRTKLQVRVKALSDALPKLTDVQEQWAFKHCLQHVAFRNKTQTGCLDCGHVWPSMDNKFLLVILGDKNCVCPGCGTKLTIQDTRKKKVYQREFLGWLDTVEDFQVNRFFEIYSYHKKGEAPKHYISEVVQQWLQPNGKDLVVAKNRGSMGQADNFHGDLEIRESWNLHWKYNICPTAIYPGAKCLPIYKRNGIKGKIPVNVGPFDLFTAIIKDNIAETLLKAKQFDLLGERCSNDRRSEVGRYWDSVKICIRNKYIVKEAITWLDYLKLLDYFKKDLRNPKYICPKDLKSEHNKLVAKKTEIDKRARYTYWLVDLGKEENLIKNWSGDQLKDEYERLIAAKNAVEKAKAEAKRKKEQEKDELLFRQSKAAFFGMVISSGDLSIKVLESIQEFIEEGEAHKHCVFTNKYYNKPDSLILSARVDGQPMETIELDLKKMKIIQSRGLGNSASKYNKDIQELLNKNMKLIKKAYKQATKSTDADIAA